MVGIGHCRIFARSNVILNDKTNIKSEPKWPNRDIVEEHETKLSIIFSSIWLFGEIFMQFRSQMKFKS